MDKAKIRLSSTEAELVANADWILTKNGILQKVRYMLEELQSEQQRFLESRATMLPVTITAIPAKISRGENYKGLPYLVLDYPRLFGKDDQFAMRTLFWWGNFFSITLHLTGSYKMLYTAKLQRTFDSLKNESYFIGVSDDQWEHHFESSNYLSLGQVGIKTFNHYLADKPFIKLAKKIPLEEWDNAGEMLFMSFCKMIGWLSQ